MVAAESVWPNFLEIVRLPAGSAVSTQVSITASRTWRSRSFRDPAMSPKLLPANNLDRSPQVGQVADEGVQAEPALGCAYQPLVPDLRPAPLHPTGGSRRQRAAEGGKWHPCIGPQREVQALEFPLLLGQDLLGVDRRQPGGHRAPIGLPRRQIPATHPAVEGMRRGAEPEIGATRPVGGIMTRAEPVATRVRHLVEMIAGRREPRVSTQVFVRVSLVVGGGRDTA